MLAGHLARERWGLHVAEGLSDPWQLSPPQRVRLACPGAGDMGTMPADSDHHPTVSTWALWSCLTQSPHIRAP